MSDQRLANPEPLWLRVDRAKDLDPATGDEIVAIRWQISATATTVAASVWVGEEERRIAVRTPARTSRFCGRTEFTQAIDSALRALRKSAPEMTKEIDSFASWFMDEVSK